MVTFADDRGAVVLLLRVLIALGTVVTGDRLSFPGTKSTPHNTEFRWGFMPTYNTFRFVILHPPAEATAWRLQLSAANGTSVNQTSGILPTAPVGETWQVRPLEAGRYTIMFELTAARSTINDIRSTTATELDVDTDTESTEATVLAYQTSFNRTVRPFEAERLGLDDIIVPPWTPIQTYGFARNNITIPGTAGTPPRTNVGQPINDGDHLGFMKPSHYYSPNSRTYVLQAAGLLNQIHIVPPPTPRDNCTCCIGFECFKNKTNNPSCDHNLCQTQCGPLGEQCHTVCLKGNCPDAVPLLAAPMTLVATTIDEFGVPVEHALNTTHQGPIGNLTSAKLGGQASIGAAFGPWQTGPVTGRTYAQYDYDGCIKISLELQPTTVPITSLQLRIPLRMSPTDAFLTHTVTDQIRIHYAGAIPEGEGEVYTTTAVNRYQLPGPFVPYIYVGGAERGIAFFADNDKDWIAAEPAYQLLRNSTNQSTFDQKGNVIYSAPDGSMTLQVNLISPNSPHTQGLGVILNKSRTITFGLLATPIKPQPNSPVNPRAHWPPYLRTDKTGQSQASLNLVANSMYWGSAGNDDGFYPYNHNYTFWKWLQAVKGGAGDPNFENQWLAHLERLCVSGGNITCPPGSPPTCKKSLSCELATGKNNLNQAVGACHAAATTANMDVVPYTNPQSIIWDADTETFMDEWTMFDVADPRWGTWGLCWPDYKHGKFGKLPCPNMTLGPQAWCDNVPESYCPFGSAGLDPQGHAVAYRSVLWYSGWKYGLSSGRNQTVVRRLNYEATHDWQPPPDCTVEEMTFNIPGCGGYSDAGTDYYRTAYGSYADMMMYYHEKMLTTFADGVYYDNVYLNTLYQPGEVGGPAYVADTDVSDDGALHPGVGLWGLRDMVRRSATLQHSLGKKRTSLMFHMTSWNVVPVVGWATVNYDWEQHIFGDGTKYADCQRYNLTECSQHWGGRKILSNDFQTRFNLDDNPGLVLAQTAGLQTGTIPYIVRDGGVGTFNGTCYQRPDLNGWLRGGNVTHMTNFCQNWIIKTHFAVTIVHEVRPGGNGCQPNSDIHSPKQHDEYNLTYEQCMIPGSPDNKFKPTPGPFNVVPIMIEHGYDDPRCDVYRYWEPPVPVNISGTATSVYPLVVRCPVNLDALEFPNRGPGRVLAIFSSFGKVGGQVQAQMNQTELGIQTGAKATDAISREPIQITADGLLSFWLNSHDFRMVSIV